MLTLSRASDGLPTWEHPVTGVASVSVAGSVSVVVLLTFRSMVAVVSVVTGGLSTGGGGIMKSADAEMGTPVYGALPGGWLLVWVTTTGCVPNPTPLGMVNAPVKLPPVSVPPEPKGPPPTV